MTRNDIISFCQDELGELDGTEGALSPFGWDRLVSNAADYLARKTRCLYVDCGLDLVAGQSDYCAPPVDRILGARVTNSSGTLISLRFNVPTDAFAGNGYTEYANAAGTPRAAVALGANTLRLTPPPDYSTTAYAGGAGGTGGGLYIEGYGHPANSWPLPTDECPLPEKMHMAVAWHACEARARRMKDYVAMQQYERQWVKEKNQMVRDMLHLTPVAMSRYRMHFGQW